MVVDPHDENRNEADHIRQQRRPLCQQCANQICAAGGGVIEWRDLDLENQQGDGNREYTIAKRLQARSVFLFER
jgi:hypothetical protein